MCARGAPEDFSTEGSLPFLYLFLSLLNPILLISVEQLPAARAPSFALLLMRLVLRMLPRPAATRTTCAALNLLIVSPQFQFDSIDSLIFSNGIW
jgi:hypothetical protein